MNLHILLKLFEYLPRGQAHGATAHDNVDEPWIEDSPDIHRFNRLRTRPHTRYHDLCNWAKHTASDGQNQGWVNMIFNEPGPEPAFWNVNAVE